MTQEDLVFRWSTNVDVLRAGPETREYFHFERGGYSVLSVSSQVFEAVLHEAMWKAAQG